MEVVIVPFASYGRLAHVRRALLAVDGITAVRIAGYADQRAHFVVDLAPGVGPDCIAISGTALRSITASRVELVVRSNGARHD